MTDHEQHHRNRRRIGAGRRITDAMATATEAGRELVELVRESDDPAQEGDLLKAHAMLCKASGILAGAAHLLYAPPEPVTPDPAPVTPEPDPGPPLEALLEVFGPILAMLPVGELGTPPPGLAPGLVQEVAEAQGDIDAMTQDGAPGGFQECPHCAKKPGFAALCAECLERRAAHYSTPWPPSRRD